MLATEPVEFFFEHIEVYNNDKFEKKKENLNTTLLVIVENLTTDDVKSVCSIFHLVSTAQTLGFDTRIVIQEKSADLIKNSDFFEKSVPNINEESDKVVKEYIETQLYLGGKVFVDIDDSSEIQYNSDEDEAHIKFIQLKNISQDESWILEAIDMAKDGKIEEISEKYQTTTIVV